MNDSVLKELLKEYEQKRIFASEQLDKRKSTLNAKYPKLAELEDKINTLCIQEAKSIISSDQEHIDDIKKKIILLKEEKQKIISSLKIDSSYLIIQYECPICKDTGYITKNYSSKMCNCLKQKLFNIEYNKSNIGNIEKENFETFSLQYYSDEINEKKYNSKLSPKENIKTIKKICENFITNFEQPEQKNLLFTGNTGLGKTFLSNCIAKSILEKGKTVLYQTAPVMLDSIIDYRFGKGTSSFDFYNSLLEVDLLIIDDLGTETVNNLKFTELFNVINSRLLNQNRKTTKTIISTNLSLQNLFSTYDERIVSRIIGYYDICRFYGDDIRFQLHKK